MPRQLPLIIFVSFIVWLFFRDRKLRPMTSYELWIPLIWIVIIGTRPVSMWFNVGGLQQVDSLDSYLEGNPFDRNIYITLILAGIIILFKRRIKWGPLIKSNYFFVLFFVFCGLSCLWSDYAFASIKRYIKDCGNVVMAIILITEANPKQAFRAVLARYSYVALTLSFLFIMYYPELGRYYNRWSYHPSYCGIATNKNGMGAIAFICGVFLIMDFMTTWAKSKITSAKMDVFIKGVLIAMVIWLLRTAQSSTSIVCFVLGIAIITCLNTSFGKKQVRNLGMWTLGFLFIFIIIFTVPDFLAVFTGIVGRDATLTGRTEMWPVLLAQPINPLLGSGFQSFWQTPAAAAIGESFYYIPTQAHNGFLEVYLQTGIISLLLLIGAIITAINRLKKGILSGCPHAILLFTILIICLANNWTEGSINKLCLLWILMIQALLYDPRTSSKKIKNP